MILGHPFLITLAGSLKTAEEKTGQDPFTHTQQAMNLVTYILGFLLVIGLLFIALRFLRQYSSRLGESKHMRLLDTLAIDNEKKLLLVEVGDQVLLVGAGKELNLLTSVKLSPEELQLIRESSSQQPLASISMLWQRIKERVPSPFSHNETQDQEEESQQGFEQRLQQELEKIRRSKGEGGQKDDE